MLRELTHEEKVECISAFQELVDEDDWDAAIALAQTSFPMPATIAKAVYMTGGKDFLLSLGYDLSEAEAAYGSDWLDR